jgi:hypothetical protein
MRHERGPVAINLSTSRVIQDIAAKLGVCVIVRRSGKRTSRTGCSKSQRLSAAKATAVSSTRGLATVRDPFGRDGLGLGADGRDGAEVERVGKRAAIVHDRQG